eukprot:TRINITY_DN3811_c1_g2_i1.p1 TRINITY_DN3811_c1_g2~~TRINITY_DN3811_c1_g2_i1.p1  ORF type:complete len:472 (+),score=118.34 TRINITY_DN3811_c1_g2_i1:74-1489(+)
MVESKSGEGECNPVPASMPLDKSIFNLAYGKDGSGGRAGELMGVETPMFTLLTSRGLPLHLRPQVLCSQLQGRCLFQLPVGDLVLREKTVKECPRSAEGCRGFWPHLKGQLTYCSYRNPYLKDSVFGGDSVCSVETSGGRKKMGPRDLLDIQQVMRADLVAAPGEEVPLDIVAPRRLHRTVDRASDWLKKILDAKASEPGLAFDWHILASIQGGGSVKLRRKACAAAAALPVGGFVVGGLGYGEALASRATVLQAVTEALPTELPRFLPLGAGGPDEVLQAVLLGIDVLEVKYPLRLAADGIALNISWEMPDAEKERSMEEVEKDLAPLLSAAVAGDEDAPVTAPADAAPRRVALQLQLRGAEFREDFGPISAQSKVSQYSRAYIYHLLQVRELLGTMLITQHNLHVYESFFIAMRQHIRQGTLRQFASWFFRTQMCEEEAAAAAETAEGAPAAKRRRRDAGGGGGAASAA